MTELRRALGLLDATMVNVGVMIGSAVFLTASDVARVFPHPLVQLAAWVVAALFSLAGALTIAELSAALPEAGGLSVYLDRAFGRFWGFFYGWALFVVIQTAGIAAVARHPIATEKQRGVHRKRRRQAQFAAGGVAVRAAGRRMADHAGLVLVAFLGSGGSWSHLSTPSGAQAAGLAAMGAALVGPLFAFDGWITISYMGGEVKRPARNLPLAALASVAIVAAIYLALNAAYLFVLGSSGVARSGLVAADTARALLGERGADLAAGMVALATLGGLNGNVLGGARVLYAMAHAGVFWRAAGQVHDRFGTPAAALGVQGLVSMAFVLTGRFDQLLTSSLFASWLFYAMGGVAVFVLRRDRRLERPYRVPGYPVVPALFIVFAALLLASTIVADPRDSLLGIALLLTAIPVYLVVRRRRRS